jgi:uncharacterized protein YecA (UPF0149 family)
VTLIFGAANSAIAVLAADRRLSSDGETVDDNTTKLTALFCDDARLAVAYTGLARRGAFCTEIWLPDRLRELAADVTSIYQLLPRLEREVDQAIKAVDPDGRITISLLGFTYDDDGTSTPVRWSISRSPQGTEMVTASTNEPILVEAGDLKPRTRAVVETFHSQFPAGGDALSLAALSNYTMRKAAGTTETISPHGNVAVVTAERNDTVRSFYFVSEPEHDQYAANCVISAGGSSMMTRGGLLHSSPDGAPVAFPNARRNDPCPCGSEVKYKHCHQRTTYGYLPLRTEQTISDPSPAGHRFVLECRGAWGRAV